MRRKLAPFAALLMLAGCNQYSREVDRTPEQVSSALVDLDISDQPGAPGSDPSRAGGLKPVLKYEKTQDGVVWKVMSGDDVAITMTAHLAPLDGGKRTRVTASVERGDAPDDFVSPAFRSEGIALGLFTMAIETNSTTLPGRRQRVLKIVGKCSTALRCRTCHPPTFNSERAVPTPSATWRRSP